MTEIIIDEEFKSILPALDKKTYARLEERLLENGCMHPLTLWGNILIDGYNRYEICTKHDIPFSTVDMEFKTRDAVVIWIILTQISRRNLTPIQLSYYRGLHYMSDKKLRGDSDRFAYQGPKSQNGTMDGSTAKYLAKEYNVSRNTIMRDAKVAEAINAIGSTSPEAKRNILSGEAGITKKHLNELLSSPEEDVIETAVQIENGTYERKRPAALTPTKDNSPDNSALAELSPVNAAIVRTADAFNADVRRLATGSSAAELKTTIRSFIATLEGLHAQL